MMKRLIRPILAAALLAVLISCSSDKAREKANKYFEELAEAYDKADLKNYSDVQEEYLSFFKDMSSAEQKKALYDAFQAFADNWMAKNPNKSFKNYFDKMVGYEINHYETSARMLIHLYEGAEQVAHTKADFENGQMAYKSLDGISYAMKRGTSETVRQLFGDWDAKREEKEAAFATKRLIDANGVGPVKIGASIAALPASAEGVYDFFILDKSVEEEDGDVWEVTTYKFYYLGELALVVYPSYDDPDKVRCIDVESSRFHTQSGISTISRCGEVLEAGGQGFYFVQGFLPYCGMIYQGLIMEDPELSFYFNSKLRRAGDEPALWLDQDDIKPLGFFSKIVIPAPDQVENIRNMIDNWESF